MASKKTLNEKNLQSLGARRLAALLMEISAGDAAAKRRLRLELAGAQSPEEVAKEVRKRLATIARSRSYVEWHKQKELVSDLETQRRAIAEQVAKTDPATALTLMWQFLALAGSVYGRCDDSGGAVSQVFQSSVADLGTLATAAKANQNKLAEDAFKALTDREHGETDGLVRVLAPALGRTGLDRLKRQMIAFSKAPIAKPRDQDRQRVGFGMGGAIYEDELEQRARDYLVRSTLMEIADAQGDVDAFIGQFDEQARKAPKIAAEIAKRLLEAKRAHEAWQVIERTEHRRSGWNWPDFGWENARIEVLEALGRGDDAQKARLSCFERSLSASHLRAYLKRLPEFDDVEAEERALTYAQNSNSVLLALSFLISWPALDRASQLVTERGKDLDGNSYDILAPAADALAGKHPLAATVVLRSMIDFTLSEGRYSRYKHAARHLVECARLGPAIKDFRSFEPHDAYEARLRREHARKSSFWTLIA